MSLAAILSMIISLAVVIGGFFFFLSVAIKTDSRKKN